VFKRGKIVKFKPYIYVIKMLHIHDENLLFLVLYGFLENLILLQRTKFFPPHLETSAHGTRETGEKRERGLSSTTRNARAPHMNQSPLAATRAREVQIFLQLLDVSTIPYCTLRLEIGLIRDKYVAVLTFQCSINGSPLGTVNCIQETMMCKMFINNRTS